MVSGNAQRSIVERSARYAVHRIVLRRCDSLAKGKADAHRRYRRHIARHLQTIVRGRQDAEGWDLSPAGRRLTGWQVA